MYNKTNKAHVTPKARTDVFVGHGSKMVTVLSRRKEKKLSNVRFLEYLF